MGDENTRCSTISNRSKAIVNMVNNNSSTVQNSNQTRQNKTAVKKSKEGGSAKPVPDDYINRLYERPYSMNSAILETFCETQISYNYIDLTCKELMPIQDSPHSTSPPICNDLKNNELSSKGSKLQDISTQFDFDSDDSEKDKDYIPSDTESDISINDSLEITKKRQKLQTPQKNMNFHDMVSNVQKKNLGLISIEPIQQKQQCHHIFQKRVVKRRSTLESNQPEKLHPLNRKRRYTTDITLNEVQPREDKKLEEPVKKRKKYSTTAAERKLEAKNKKKIEEYSVKIGCNNKCLKKCSSNFSNEDRSKINTKFWSLTWQQRHASVNSNTSIAVPNRKCTKNAQRNPKRNFHLKNRDGVNVNVCKVFFLTTLGYKKTNDRILHSSFTETDVDKRGKHTKTSHYDRDLLTKHVESFHPVEPHYRREHAPLRRYIPSDINIASMHKDFNSKHPNVSYELYRMHVKKMNISFTRLGNEECELCEAYNLHKMQTSHDGTNDVPEDCSSCAQWAQHHQKYNKARALYASHKELKQNESQIYVSTDLEKVIMLPRMESFKSVIFCQRLVAYNQTFAPVGKITSDSKPMTVLWHDAIAGRKQEDIMSAFYQFFLRHRDVKNIHMWLDNCSAQNKNWLLYSLLVHLINGQYIATEKIVMYYFEPGHTFMSSDQVHHQVELAMKKKQKLYDFNDFEDAVASINNSKVVVKSLSAECFLNIPNYVSDRRIQNSNPRAYLKNMSQVCFERNNFDLKYKNSLDQEEYTTLRFMNDKYMKNPNIMKIEFRSSPKGIDKQRKYGIVEKLSNIIPPHKLLFWKNFPESNQKDASTSGTRNYKKLGQD